MSTNNFCKIFSNDYLLQNLVHCIDGNDQVCHNTQTKHVFSFIQLCNEATEYDLFKTCYNSGGF